MPVGNGVADGWVLLTRGCAVEGVLAVETQRGVSYAVAVGRFESVKILCQGVRVVGL